MKSNSLEIFQRKSKFLLEVSIERSMADIFLKDALDLIFPGMLRKNFKSSDELEAVLSMHLNDLERILRLVSINESMAKAILEDYSNQIIPFSKEIEKMLRQCFQEIRPQKL